MGWRLDVEIFLKSEADLVENLKKFYRTLEDLEASNFSVDSEILPYELRHGVISRGDEGLDTYVERVFRLVRQKCPDAVSIGNYIQSIQLNQGDLNVDLRNKIIHWRNNASGVYSNIDGDYLPGAFLRMVKEFANELDCECFQIRTDGDGLVYFDDPYCFALDNLPIGNAEVRAENREFLALARQKISHTELVDVLKKAAIVLNENSTGGVCVMFDNLMHMFDIVDSPRYSSTHQVIFSVRRKLREVGVKIPFATSETNVLRDIAYAMKLDSYFKELVLNGVISEETLNRVKQEIAAHHDLEKTDVVEKFVRKNLEKMLDPKERLGFGIG